MGFGADLIPDLTRRQAARLGVGEREGVHAQPNERSGSGAVSRSPMPRPRSYLCGVVAETVTTMTLIRLGASRPGKKSNRCSEVTWLARIPVTPEASPRA